MNPADSRIGILYLTSAPFLGGAVYGLRSIVRRLDRTRFRPVIAFPESSTALPAFFRDADVTLAPVATRPLERWSPRAALNLARTVGDLARVCRENDIRIFHTTSQRASLLGPLLRACTGVKFVWQIAFLGEPWYMRFLARFPDCAPCISTAVFEEFGARKNMRVLLNGPWTEGLSPAQCQARRVELRRELGIAEDALVVGGMANLQYWKGVHVLLEGFARAACVLPEILLVHLGGPVPGYEPYARQIDSQIAALDLGARVRRLGFRSDGYRYFPLFDLFVHVPVAEGRYRCTEAFGHSVAEAMGYRVPVISSRIGGPAEIVVEGVTGELIEPGNSSELAEKIIGLLGDPARRSRLGEAGYARYSEHFTIQREVREYEQLYLELASSNGRPRPGAADLSSKVLSGFRGHWRRKLAGEGAGESPALAESGQLPFVAMLERLLQERHAPGALRVLEVGAGAATVSHMLARKSSGAFVALDILPEAMSVARRAMSNGRAATVQLLVADVCRAPLPDASFDLVFSQGLLEHFRDPGEILAAQVRLLKPGGMLVVNVPQKFNLFTLYKRWQMRRGEWPPGWETEFSPRQLILLGKRFGLAPSRVDGHGSFLSQVAVRLSRAALSPAAQARIVRLADSADRALGSTLRAWLCTQLIVGFRKVGSPPVKEGAE